MVSPGDLVSFKNLFAVVKCLAWNPKNVVLYEESSSSDQALENAFHTKKGPEVFAGDLKLLKSPCHHLWGKFKKGDLIKIKPPEYAAYKDRDWYAIANRITVSARVKRLDSIIM